MTVETRQTRQVVDITDEVQSLIAGDAGLCTVFVAHTTCAVTTADLDPGMEQNIADAVWEMIPKLKYQPHHNMEHLPSHLAATIVGPSVTVPVRNGKLVLGTWQRIILIELDGPRSRQLMVINH